MPGTYLAEAEHPDVRTVRIGDHEGLSRCERFAVGQHVRDLRPVGRVVRSGDPLLKVAPEAFRPLIETVGFVS